MNLHPFFQILEEAWTLPEELRGAELEEPDEEDPPTDASRALPAEGAEVPAEKGKEVEEAMPPPPVPAKKVLSPTTFAGWLEHAEAVARAEALE